MAIEKKYGVAIENVKLEALYNVENDEFLFVDEERGYNSGGYYPHLRRTSHTVKELVGIAKMFWGSTNGVVLGDGIEACDWRGKTYSYNLGIWRQFEDKEYLEECMRDEEMRDIRESKAVQALMECIKRVDLELHRSMQLDLGSVRFEDLEEARLRANLQTLLNDRKFERVLPALYSFIRF